MPSTWSEIVEDIPVTLLKPINAVAVDIEDHLLAPVSHESNETEQIDSNQRLRAVKLCLMLFGGRHGRTTEP